MYPIRFEPIYKDYVWGGERIGQKYGRKVGKAAESWEISDREEGMSVVANGIYKGRTLHELLLELGEKLIGEGQKCDRFPLLLKIIDAKESLSIQVHPDSGPEAKTEMWFILDNSAVYAGLKKGVNKEALQKAKKMEELLEHYELRRGEAVYIPGGRVHAICAGSLLFEVQQNSNTTYRLYDWGRKSRDLHVKEALEAMNWHDKSQAKATLHKLSSDMQHQLVTVVSSPFFIVERYDIFKAFHIGSIPQSFQIFFFIEGEGTIEVDGTKEPFKAGQTFLVPAASQSIDIAGKCQALRIRLP